MFDSRAALVNQKKENSPDDYRRVSLARGRNRASLEKASPLDRPDKVSRSKPDKESRRGRDNKVSLMVRGKANHRGKVAVRDKLRAKVNKVLPLRRLVKQRKELPWLKRLGGCERRPGRWRMRPINRLPCLRRVDSRSRAINRTVQRGAIKSLKRVVVVTAKGTWNRIAARTSATLKRRSRK